MPYDPRTLAYICEILHPPIQHDAAKLHGVHGALFQDQRAGYKNFALVPGGAALSNPIGQPNQISSVSFLADRIQIREELTNSTLDDFTHRVSRLAKLAAEEVGIQVFTAQQVIIRSVISPRHFEDSREFLASGVFSISRESFAVVGRPAQLLGFRAIYPQTPEENSVYSLRVESFNNDPRSVFVEVVATFPPMVTQQPFAKPVSQGASSEQLGANVADTYRFLEERALAFLEQFDQPQE